MLLRLRNENIFTIPSREPEAPFPCFNDTVRAFTSEVCLRTSESSMFLRFHSRVVLSQLQEIIEFEFPTNETSVTTSV